MCRDTWEGFVLGKGAVRAACHPDLREPCSQRVISVPLARNGLKIVDKINDLAFGDIHVNSGPLTELFD